jgi:hypothetical protein
LAHIAVIAAAADLLRWGAFSPFAISREEQFHDARHPLS